jgi:hypothetical protein
MPRICYRLLLHGADRMKKPHTNRRRPKVPKPPQAKALSTSVPRRASIFRNGANQAVRLPLHHSRALHYDLVNVGYGVSRALCFSYHCGRAQVGSRERPSRLFFIMCPSLGDSLTFIANIAEVVSVLIWTYRTLTLSEISSSSVAGTWHRETRSHSTFAPFTARRLMHRPVSEKRVMIQPKIRRIE